MKDKILKELEVPPRIKKKGNLKPQRKLFFRGGEKFALVHANRKRKTSNVNYIHFCSW
jgi:hypothetical protein